MSKITTEELATWMDSIVPLEGEYDEAPDYSTLVAARLRELQAEVERLKGANAAAKQLISTMWNRADDWHGPIASSHFRSEIAEKIRDLTKRGEHWDKEEES